MKLNTITQRKKKYFEKKRNNNKTCYLYNKSNYFARNCWNKIIQRRQFNTMFKKKSNTKKKINDKNSEFSLFDWNNDEKYIFVSNQKIFAKISKQKNDKMHNELSITKILTLY